MRSRLLIFKPRFCSWSAWFSLCRVVALPGLLEQSVSQNVFLIFFLLVVGFSEDCHLLQKHPLVDGYGHPWVQFSLSLSLILLLLFLCLLARGHLLSLTNTSGFCFLWLFGPCWQFLFSPVGVFRRNVYTKTKWLSKEATSSFPYLVQTSNWRPLSCTRCWFSQLPGD